jgi:hypothetical protein
MDEIRKGVRTLRAFGDELGAVLEEIAGNVEELLNLVGHIGGFAIDGSLILGLCGKL